jgi:predicted phosphohydrolase
MILVSRFFVAASLLSALTLVAFRSAGAAPNEELPAKLTSEVYQVKIVNDTGADILVRAVSYNRNWDAPVVKKASSFTAHDERHYLRKGDKVFVAYDVASKKVIASKVIDINGPTVITFTAAKDVTAGPLAAK